MGTELVRKTHHDLHFGSVPAQIRTLEIIESIVGKNQICDVFWEWAAEGYAIHPQTLLEHPALQYRYYLTRLKAEGLWLKYEQYSLEQLRRVELKEDDYLMYVEYTHAKHALESADWLNAEHRCGIKISKEFLSRLTYYRLRVE